MKKLLILSFVLLIGLWGCGNGSEKYDDTKLINSIDDIKTQLISLQDALELYDLVNQDLEDKITLLEGDTSELEDKIKELQKERARLSEEVSKLTKDLETLETATGNVEIFLAKEYDLVVGNNFQLFYRSIIQAVNPYGFYIKLTGEYGHAYNRYFEWTPELDHANKTYELKVEICDNLGKVLKTATTKLNVHNFNKSTEAKNILCIGDSLTANGYWVSYGAEKYKEMGGTNLNFVGTTTGGYNGTSYKYEGHGGWQWSSYLSVTESPFSYSGSPSNISFKEYSKKHSFGEIDELYILMTWNGIGGRFRTFNMNSEPFVSAKKLIDQYHLDYPNGKVTLLGIPQPSVNAGLGAYYEIRLSYGDNYGQFVTALNYNKQLEEFANLEEYKSFMRYVDVKGQFDSEFNMPSSPKAVNEHSNVTEPVGNSMGMHPSTQGYLQIGDVFYRALSNPWNS